MKISVVICTYNRAASLARTLDSLAAQRGVDWADVEVLVVDNNCTDETSEVVSETASRLPLRVVREPNQGHSHARNRAILEARGDWILFTDDDVLLDPEWIGAYREALEAYPQASFAGGRVVPLWPDGAPAWFKGQRLDGLDGVLVWYELSDQTHLLQESDPTPFGASFAFRKACIEEIGWFRTDLGMCAKQIGLGDDVEFLGRFRSRGLAGVYVGRALCRHPVDPKRLTLGGLFRRGIASGRAHRAMSGASVRSWRLKSASFLLRGVYQLLKGRGDRFRQCVLIAGRQRGLSERA